MAKKNVRDEPLKPQVTENEQMSDIVFILDKMELAPFHSFKEMVVITSPCITMEMKRRTKIYTFLY